MIVIDDRQKKYLLENMGRLYERKTVHNIRDLAKALGAPSPTSKKKEENWANLKAILEGKMPSKYPKSNTASDYEKYKTEVEKWLNELYDGEKIEINKPTAPSGVRNAPFEFINDSRPDAQCGEEVEGWLDVVDRKYGFLRTKGADVFVDGQFIQSLRLRNNDVIKGFAKKDEGARSAKLIKIVSVNDTPLDQFVSQGKLRFEDLKATFPDKRLRLESKNPFNFALRAIDLVAPVGRGQRGLIVSPPKAGKTTLLKQIAQSLIRNYPDDLTVMMLLIDERPEEVTDMENEVAGCEIMSSTFDREQEHHVKVAEQCLQKAKRLVEAGKDVVILLDSITRLARAYNQVGEASGRTLSGGLDVAALKEPKKFFGAARNTDGHGSLTIIATALVNTGSRMDDVIYEEFKGTGNMEIHLDRKLSERRIFPAIDLEKSGTRREDLLYDERELTDMWAMRRMLSKAENGEGIEMILDMLTKTKTNDEFLTLFEISINKKQ